MARIAVRAFAVAFAVSSCATGGGGPADGEGAAAAGGGAGSPSEGGAGGGGAAGDAGGAGAGATCSGPGEVTRLGTDDCYLLIDDVPTTWHVARTQCVAWGGDLAAVTTAEEQAFVASILPDRTWIGLNDLASEGSWAWSNGEPFSYFNWHDTQPDNADPGEHCVEVRPSHDYGWNDLPCDYPLIALCER